MKKLLILCLAIMLSSASVYAKNMLSNDFNKKPIAKAVTALTPEKSGIVRSSITPSATEMPQMYTKELSLVPILGEIYRSSFNAVSGFSFATYYNENLTARFKGNKVTALYTAFPDCASSVEIWFRKSISGANIWSKTITGLNSSNTNTIVEVSCDYVLDGDPLYVGYTVTISGLTLSPKAYVYFTQDKTDDYSLLIDFNNGNGWYNYSESMGTWFMTLATEGENGLKNHDICLNYLDASTRVKTGEDYEVKGEIVNYGAYKAKSIKGKFAGNELNIELPDSLGFMQSTEITIPQIAWQEPGRYTNTCEITHVNGNADTYPDNSQTTTLVSIGTSYNRAAVMETLTDTGDGWSPAAIVAHEEIKKYEVNVIGIDVHGYTGSTDPFMTNTYAQLYDLDLGTPMAILNRNYMTYADYGYQYVQEYITSILGTQSEAVIDIKSKLSDDKKTIDFESTIAFGLDCETTPYSVAYVLTEDELTATQANYFSSQYASQTGLTQTDLPSEFFHLWNQYGTYTATYNNVARGIYDCWGINNSLSGKITEGEVRTHKFSVSTPSAIKNLDKVNAIALLFDNETGEIVTAAKAKLGEASTGVDNVTSDDNQNNILIAVANDCINFTANNASVTIYNTNGQVVASEEINGNGSISTAGLNGIHIIKVNTNDNVTVKKVIL